LFKNKLFKDKQVLIYFVYTCTRKHETKTISGTEKETEFRNKSRLTIKIKTE
jgi:hypothetical protein